MDGIYVCNIYRLESSTILPDRAFSSFESLLDSLHADYMNNFDYNGETQFNEFNECIISSDEHRQFVFVAKRLLFSS